MLCASIINLAFVCGRVSFAECGYGGWCLESGRRSRRLPDEAHLGLVGFGWWPAISEIEGSVGQELGVVGSQQTTRPMIASKQRPPPLPSAPPSHAKKKPRPAVCEAWFLFCTPYGIRTRVTGVRGRRPRPLDERGLELAILLLLAYQDSNLE